MDKKWVLETLTQIEDRLDFPPEKSSNFGGFQPLLTPETYDLIKEKYGSVPYHPKPDLETESRSVRDNVLVKVSYIKFENEALKREIKERDKVIERYEKLLRYKDSKIKGLNDKLKKKSN